MKSFLYLICFLLATQNAFSQDFKAASERARKIATDGKPYAYREASRDEGILALGILGGDENVQFLATMLDRFHDDSAVRSKILAAIRTSGSKAANRKLLDLGQRDPESRVRSDAIETLGATKDQSMIAPLEALLETEKNDSVARSCGTALKQISGLEYPTERMPATFSSFKAHVLYSRAQGHAIPAAVAEKMLLEAAELSPKAPEIWIALGNRFKAKDNEKAIQYFLKAVELGPSDESLLSLGDLYQQKSEYVKAEEFFQKASKSCTTDTCRENVRFRLKMLEIIRKRDPRPHGV